MSDVHYHLNEAVKAAHENLLVIAEAIASLHPAELIEFREAHEHFDGYRKLKQALGLIDAEMTKAFCDADQDVTFDGNVYYPTRTKSAERWDGEGLASQCAARATDWYHTLDEETGEMVPVPPVVLSTKIVTAITKCLGGFAPSTSWRTSFLASEFGIDKATVAKYRSSEPGSPKIGSRPAQVGDVAA